MLKFRSRKPTKKEAEMAIFGCRPVEIYLCCDVCGKEAKQGTHLVSFNYNTMTARIRCKMTCDHREDRGWDELNDKMTLRIPKSTD